MVYNSKYIYMWFTCKYCILRKTILFTSLNIFVGGLHVKTILFTIVDIFIGGLHVKTILFTTVYIAATSTNTSTR